MRATILFAIALGLQTAACGSGPQVETSKARAAPRETSAAAQREAAAAADNDPVRAPGSILVPIPTEPDRSSVLTPLEPADPSIQPRTGPITPPRR